MSVSEIRKVVWWVLGQPNTTPMSGLSLRFTNTTRVNQEFIEDPELDTLYADLAPGTGEMHWAAGDDHLECDHNKSASCHKQSCFKN